MSKTLICVGYIIRILSVLSLLVLLPAKVVLAKCGWEIPSCWNEMVSVLVVAAVGCIANWIAIVMVFKSITILLHDDEIIRNIAKEIKKLIVEYRGSVAKKIVEGFYQYSSQVTELIKEKLYTRVCDYCNNKPILRPFSAEFSKALSNRVDWQSVEQLLKDKLVCSQTFENIENGLESFVKFDVEGFTNRISQAFYNLDGGEFQAIINSLIAKRFAAISLLGYGFGVLVGLVQIIV